MTEKRKEQTRQAARELLAFQAQEQAVYDQVGNQNPDYLVAYKKKVAAHEKFERFAGRKWIDGCDGDDDADLELFYDELHGMGL